MCGGFQSDVILCVFQSVVDNGGVHPFVSLENWLDEPMLRCPLDGVHNLFVFLDNKQHEFVDSISWTPAKRILDGLQKMVAKCLWTPLLSTSPLQHAHAHAHRHTQTHITCTHHIFYVSLQKSSLVFLTELPAVSNKKQGALTKLGCCRSRGVVCSLGLAIALQLTTSSST